MSNTINLEINLEDFKAVCATHSRANDFTTPALEAIFEKISEEQTEDGICTSLNDWFISAGEQTSRDLVEYNIHLASDHTEALIDIANGVPFYSDELKAALENEEGEYSSDDLWRLFKDEILKSEDFILEAADVLAEAADENYKKLSNDNWLSFS